MSLRVPDLRAFLGLLNAIDEGRAAPSVPGHIGRFLRQYQHARSRLCQVLRSDGLRARADGAFSGVSIGRAQLSVIGEIRTRVQELPMGESADALYISEELGAVGRAVLWLKAPAARMAFNAVTSGSSFFAEGDYRWTPPIRWTAGESEITESATATSWTDARCITAVADDIDRPPHALEYVADFEIGDPGLKAFRSVCVVRDSRGWKALPALSSARSLQVASFSSSARTAVSGSEFAKLLVYREPWSENWHVVSALAISAPEALSHSLTWVDYQRELGVEFAGSIPRLTMEVFRMTGVPAWAEIEPNIGDRLLPSAKLVVRFLRGLM